MKRQNSFDVHNPAGSRRIDGNPARSDQIEIGAGLQSLIRSIQRESIVIVKKFELEILTNPHILDLPESEKHNFGIVSVCEHNNSKTIRAMGMKFGMWSLNIICRFLSNFGQNPSTGSLPVCMSAVMRTL
ncbi:hypothetical protein AVEN_58774-1 [Araneus ventricosus]|uniref:Uncharacterized protein n=1 Tax=Araneus ventricosus TaxID=182803 RepID=A0A4Y2GI63_ARAVE|nr:hypothetical protein AVEN_58774-1 [Araneus ventricosus]